MLKEGPRIPRSTTVIKRNSSDRAVSSAPDDRDKWRGEAAGEFKSAPSSVSDRQQRLADKLETEARNPKKAIEDLATGTTATQENTAAVPNTTPLRIESDKATIAAVDKTIKESQAVIDKHVDEQATSWDKLNPEPDRNTDSEGWNNWANQRAEAQTSARADGTVNAAMTNWEKDNKMPDKKTKPQEYNKWLEDRSKQEKSLRNEVKNRNEKDKNKNEKVELSEEQVKNLIKQRKKLERVANVLDAKISRSRLNPLKSKTDTQSLIQEKGKIMSEIKGIDSQLVDQITKAPLLKKLKIFAAVVAAAGGAVVLSASKGNAPQPQH